MKSYWAGTDPLFHSTSALYRFSKKLKHLKPIVRQISREALSDISAQVKLNYDDLCAKQEQNLQAPSELLQQEESVAFARWENAANLEERYLHQKSKLNWLNVGDRNTKIYHRAVKIKTSQNGIRELEASDGTLISEKHQIKEMAVNHFSGFLNHVPEDVQDISATDIGSLFEFHCSPEDQDRLIADVTELEIKDVLIKMAANKSPRSDGFTVEFFKESWSILGKDLVVSVQSFFLKGFLPKGVNSTILALIPKKEGAKHMKDYRPIACCNVIHKLISKILANRLKRLLPRFICPNQSAFVRDRLLIENLLLASELVSGYHKDTISARCALKIDISKAFDSVQWRFLLNTLEALNFPAKYIHWIRLCVSTASFSVQVNGELAGYFGSSRGLRQGCSLSPYLFVIYFLAGVSELVRANIAQRFPLAFGSLPVRYLGLPLLTKKMRTLDYAPLIGNIKGRITSWTAKALSFAGRLQLLSSVIAGITGFWMSAFRLPNGCLDEIERICSAFLWSGTDLNPRKAKLAWSAVCKPKAEGGLGLKNLREANDVCILKLLWRFITADHSLWVRWSRVNLMRESSIWLLPESNNPNLGSWSWKQMMKRRHQAAEFLKVEIGNGRSTTFWYDNWSSMGPLLPLIGARGFIDLGIRRGDTVEDVILRHRRHRHRASILNRVEDEIEEAKSRYRGQDRDRFFWKIKEGTYKTHFNTKTTRDLIRLSSPKVPWVSVIWFQHNCPKFSFIAWLAQHNRLSTGDRMQHWSPNIQGVCSFCLHTLETRSHLFFSCPYSAQIWTNLAKGILDRDFSTDWTIISTLLSSIVYGDSEMTGDMEPNHHHLLD
ncbi:uncharacterized protein LOC112087777 [Eutrema salsugineum]|uniref:uncharacterized protein LOC112087777 n=1 Tax=Eutrema salsugineum TaxID=72664 RepID=UPI000CED231B|nr:uncharacterized protein LOC112087777 [Eutrema salsugineum]